MNKRAYGFTIVELLIVIVVIAILAAISIVAYNSISVRAKVAKKEAEVAQLLRLTDAYQAVHGSAPTWDYDSVTYETTISTDVIDSLEIPSSLMESVIVCADAEGLACSFDGPVSGQYVANPYYNQSSITGEEYLLIMAGSPGNGGDTQISVAYWDDQQGLWVYEHGAYYSAWYQLSYGVQPEPYLRSNPSTPCADKTLQTCRY